MILVPMVLNSPRLGLQRGFFRVSDRFQGVDRLQNLSELIRGDRIWVQVASALQDIAIVAVALLVSLDNDICGSQNGPGIIDTSPVVFDSPGMDVAELGDLCGGVLGLSDGAVEGEVGRALVALLNNALVVLLSDQVAYLLIR